MDAVYEKARQAGLDSPMLEIRPSRTADKAWLVREYDRSTPTQVDTIAIDPRTMKVTSRADFDSFSLIPKLIRWGIDIHVGVKFGVANQIVIGAVVIALSLAIVYGYVLWWKRRPAPGSPARTLIQAWVALDTPSRLGFVVAAVATGLVLPLMGISLVLFVMADFLRWDFSRCTRSAGASSAPVG